MAERKLRVLSWNVNGLRAMLQRLGMRSLGEFLDSLEADVICVQETKMTRAELDEELAQPAGGHEAIHWGYPADECAN